MPVPSRSLARLAGLLYLLIIVMGVGADGLIRSGIPVPGDAAATAANLLANEGLFRLSILADVVMALADVGLGVTLLLLLWRVGAGLAVAATAFRLAQAAVLGLNLAFLVAAVPLARGLSGVEGSEALAALALDLHGVGYDLGLFFFAFNCFFTGVLLARFGAPRLVAAGLVASGAVYLVGSTLAVAAPAWSSAFEAAYLVPLVAELATALWLVTRAPLGVALEVPVLKGSRAAS